MTFEETPLVIVHTVDQLREAVETLGQSRVIGIDTESDSSYSYQEKVCLIQVSDLHRDYLIDPLAVKDLSPLTGLLADRSITKVLHGADYDIVCLRRDFGFKIGGLFDTLTAAQLIGLERIGLADLILRYFGVEVDKQYQRYNWALRPLRPEHVEYARGDTHFLLALREILLRELRHVGRVRHFREECRLLERREWHGKGFSPDGWLDLKRASELGPDGQRILRRIYQYRDQQARRSDRPPYKVIPDDVLVDIARLEPTTDRELDALFSSRSALRRRHGAAILDVVSRGLEDTEPLPKPRARPARKPKKRSVLRTRLRGRQAERVLSDLKSWRNEVLARDTTRNAYSVASNATLKAIASMRPRTLEELAQVPDVRRWQVADYGKELLQRLDRSDPDGSDGSSNDARSTRRQAAG